MSELRVAMPSSLLVIAENFAHQVTCWAVWDKMDMSNFIHWGHLLNGKPKPWLIWKTSICLSHTGSSKSRHHCHRQTLEGDCFKGKRQNLVLYETAYTGSMDTLILIADLVPTSPRTLSSLNFLVRKWVIGQDSLHDFQPQNPSILGATFSSP